MAFLDRQISLKFVLQPGLTFGSTGSNTLTVSGLRVNCAIQNASAPGMGQATIRVHGLSPNNLRDLCSTIRLSNGAPKVTLNNVTVSAGDSANGLNSVFQGQINIATINMEEMPDSILTLTCSGGGFEAALQIPPTSYPLGGDIYNIAQTLAAQGSPPLTFEGNNTHVQLRKQYLWGSLRDQIKQACEAADVNWTIDVGLLAIWAKGTYRVTPTIQHLSYKDGSLLGYPMNWNFGAAFKTIFNPKLYVGCLVFCESTLDYGTGEFAIADISHEIDSQVPGGRWFTYFHAIPVETL